MIDDNNFYVELNLTPKIDDIALKEIENKVSNISVLKHLEGDAYERQKEDLTRIYQLKYMRDNLEEQLSQVKTLTADEETLKLFDSLVKELNNINEQIDSLSGKSVKEVVEETKTQEDTQQKINIGEALGFDKENLKNIGMDLIENIFPKMKIANIIIEPFTNAIEKVVDTFKNAFSDAINELGKQAQYSLATTSTYSDEAVSLAMNYGLTGGESYALQSALQDTGMSSINDLMTAQMMGMTNVLETFKERFDSYVDSYEDTKELALETQEFQKEWSNFKRGLMQEFMKFFVDNKDVIIGSLDLITKSLSGILNATSSIVDFLSGPESKTDDERIRETNEIIWKTENSKVYNNDSRVFTFNNNITSQGNQQSAVELARMMQYQVQKTYR